jgi:hypothetical protein
MRALSNTAQGANKASVNKQINFIRELRQLSTSTQAQIKRVVGAEVKSSAINREIFNVFETLMATVEGQNKAALNSEVILQSNIQKDMERIKELKKSVSGVFKSECAELISAEQIDTIKRQLSSGLAMILDNNRENIGLGY